MASQIILILGAGGNIGAHVAQHFSKNGFKVALASRTVKPPTEETQDFLQIKADFNDPTNISSVFDEVKTTLGVPNVIVYNAYSMNFSPDSPVSTPLKDLSSSLAVNFTSVYAAAQVAVAGFKSLPADVIKSFIYTGNRLNIEPMPILFDLGVGKVASAHLIQSLTMTPGMKDYGFYYADERKEDGSPMGTEINGQNHAEFYLELAKKKEQGPWEATFVLGKGYVDFGGK